MFILFIIVCLVPWAALVYVVKASFLKNIRESASVYAAHYDLSVDQALNIQLKINKRTPWIEQSYSFRRVLSLFETLVQAFALAFAAFLVIVIGDLFPPFAVFWELAGITCGYLLLFLLIYLWSRGWVPRRLTSFIHLPEHTFSFALQHSTIPFARLMLAGAITGLMCAGTSHYLRLAPRGNYGFFITATYYAALFFSLRLSSVWRKNELTFPSESLEPILTEYDLDEFFKYKYELMQEIRTHPNFEAWSGLLPEDVRRVVSCMLEEKHDLELMKQADILPAEDLNNYPFLVTLLRRNPEVLQFRITEPLEEMKDAIKSYPSRT